MTSRERVLKTFCFTQPDRVAYDLMEGCVWPELMEHFHERHGLQDSIQILSHLDTDFRWAGMSYGGPEEEPPDEGLPEDWAKTYSDALYARPLAEAASVADIEAHHWPEPAWWQPADYAAERTRWPDHALVYVPGWMPLFCAACKAFGMEEALVKMALEPAVFEAFVRRQHEFYMDILSRGLAAAQGICDICWLGDDYASKDALLMGPELWRRHIKPLLAKHVQLAREHGMYVLFHSCGAVRAILPDLIDMGVNALLVFQTRAAGMDAKSIAAEFGGKMVFYGGIDCQQLLTFGTPADVKAAVRANFDAFEHCGGYIVANSHHGIANIQGENMEAMVEAARDCRYSLQS